MGKTKASETWTCQMLLTADRKEYKSIISRVEEFIPRDVARITPGEVGRVAKKMENGKSAGFADIPI